MNRQDIYNQVKNHLLQQRIKALTRNGDKLLCAYRGLNGLKCAIGCLIPDEIYDPIIENKSLLWVLTDRPSMLRHLNVETTDDRIFLVHLQDIHDCVHVDGWEHHLSLFAHKYRLTP